MAKPLFMPAEAARYLGISVKQLRDITKNGSITYINVGLGNKREARRYDITDLEQFKSEQKCRFQKDTKPQPIRTTSKSTVSDLQAIRAERQKEKLKALSAR